MELNKGFKLTEVGTIPKNWNVLPIGSFSTVSSGGTPSRNNLNYWGGKIPWVTTAQVDFKTIYTTDEHITEAGLENSAAKIVPKGSLLIALIGQGKTRGKVGKLGIDAATNQNCATIVLDRDYYCDFVFFYLASKYEAIRSLSNSGGSGSLNGAIVRSIPIPIPPVVEQEAIANAISDTDTYIESLEKLIAKKRLIKKGVMQELLTGKRRLEGFKNKWDVRCLGDFGFTYGGLTGKGKGDFGHGSARYVTFLNVIKSVVLDHSIHEFVNISEGENQNEVRNNDLLFNGSSETPEEVAFCACVKGNVKNLYLNSFCFGFRPTKDGISSDFLAYFFRGITGRELVKSLAQGATRYNISKTALLKAPFKLPTIKEQVAITEVLLDIDKDISKNNFQLQKARLIKLGMMQELLTGRIRLI